MTRSIALSIFPDSSSRAFIILLSAHSKPISFISAICVLYFTDGSILGSFGAGGVGNRIFAPILLRKGFS